MSSLNLISKIMHNPFAILASVILGLLLGLYVPASGDILGPFGYLFLRLMEMCILPIVVTSIALSLAQFFSIKTDRGLLKMTMMFASVVITCSAIGISMAVLLEPGKDIDPTSSPTLKEVIDEASMSQRGLDEPIKPELGSGIVDFLLGSIPSNIFSALADNQTFQVIIFSAIFGIALGLFLPSSNVLSNVLRAVNSVFLRLFDAITLVLPVAILCLIARDVSNIGTSILVGMAEFIGKFYLALLLLFILSSLIIMIRTRHSFLSSISILKYPIFIALGTHSSIAAIPAAIQSMQTFGFDKSLTNMLVPLGTVIGRYGNIIYFAFSAIFVTQLYNIDLLASEYAIILMLSIFAGFATSGQSGQVTLPLLGIILEPLGVPIEAVLVVFAAVDPIIEPGRTLAIVHTNCAAVSLMAPPPDDVAGDEVAVPA